ncbi:hypothetical protein TIFTF001_019247 [Ficus carica]|uniref:C2H2-type domain-containing protein n=1 Tax=Ficus carica TaxID=3494 RepID=A0AA88DJD5_FICCA|nr:hypothetical protein TIFTF001_019247 [Ficus carica]
MNTTVFDFHTPLLPPPPSTSAAAAATVAAKRHRKKRSKPLQNDVVSPPKLAADTTKNVARACSECGKTFWSWKALFGHMRCHPERHWRGINPPPNHHRPPASPVATDSTTPTPRPPNGLIDDYEIAACLLFLANNGSANDTTASTRTNTDHFDVVDEDNMSVSFTAAFECSSCKKVFRSHQALGGHRASHKNVKGCFAMTRPSSAADSGNSIGLDFDLNLPAVLEDAASTSYCWMPSSPGLALDLRLGL